MAKFNKCKRCNKYMLEKRNEKSGIIAYCHFCRGFFNFEGDFIEDGSAYFDERYTRDYFVYEGAKSLMWFMIFFFTIDIFNLPFLLVSIALIYPLTMIVRYCYLKKEGWIIE